MRVVLTGEQPSEHVGQGGEHVVGRSRPGEHALAVAELWHRPRPPPIGGVGRVEHEVEGVGYVAAVVIDPVREQRAGTLEGAFGVGADADELCADAQGEDAGSHGAVDRAASRVRGCHHDLGAVVGEHRVGREREAVGSRAVGEQAFLGETGEAVVYGRFPGRCGRRVR